ncbi:hypothetical protein P153DRAFT_383399 [Dothidotthia symphoricarpi CBS 119687]|uniref:Uncharacterized protein n=1 Tax=Dothidotthia symphoricarpi CBS 119687 TaxID=1392245 RepID=A0A6A6AI87_9PLEO|nr:uncharacterized protein P153DRAFT_383399 [Dothidotthia symphoricarpi CBS 119687]KAF2131286.1 hypothetical protein P153DRAFT_383399 [Dothidotthia symphoricarpi CBS 119687]
MKSLALLITLTTLATLVTTAMAANANANPPAMRDLLDAASKMQDLEGKCAVQACKTMHPNDNEEKFPQG